MKKLIVIATIVSVSAATETSLAIAQAQTNQITGKSAESLFQEGMKQFGLGYDENYRQAYALFQQAGDAGHLLSRAMQGILLSQGDGTPFANATMAERKAKANEQLAPLIGEMEKLANSGNLDAQFVLSICYAKGGGVEVNRDEWYKWLRDAAEQGHAAAQYLMGMDYLWKRDHTEAFKWYQKAAEQNHPAAQHSVGMSYSAGEGVEQNEDEGLKWTRRAAEQGHAGAQSWLGLCYLEGMLGVSKNISKGKEWLRKAAAQGEVMAKEALKELGIDVDAERSGEKTAENPETEQTEEKEEVSLDEVWSDQFDNGSKANKLPVSMQTEEQANLASEPSNTVWLYSVAVVLFLAVLGYVFYRRK